MFYVMCTNLYVVTNVAMMQIIEVLLPVITNHIMHCLGQQIYNVHCTSSNVNLKARTQYFRNLKNENDLLHD